MRIFFFSLPIISLFFSLSLRAQIKTIDFSDGNYSFFVFEKGGVKLEPFTGINYLKTIEAGIYKIVLPGKIEYVIEIDRGEIRSDLNEEGYATRFALITRHLSLEAAKKLSYTFHEQFGLATDDLDNWFNKLEAGKAYSMYGKGGVGDHYPRLGIALRTTFGEKQPAFAIYSISWDEKFSKRWGNSMENNKELNVVYDMPKLLEGVPEFTEVEEFEPVIVKVNDVQSLVTQPSMSDEASADVKAVEIPEQPAEKPFRWWLWLLGALIMIGGIVWIRQRTSNDSSE